MSAPPTDLPNDATLRSHEIPAKTAEVIIDIRSGERAGLDDWVRVFAQVWDKPRERLEQLLALLADDVILKAPTKPPVSKGKAQAREAFERALRGMPDLRADVRRWSSAGDVLFIELTFQATIGGHRLSWNNVDRFIFRDGRAIERVAYFDPTKVRKAFLRNLGAFRQFLRMRRGSARRRD